ncbi:urea transporter [Balneatrix alpica]|uniref:urea transporter n=1 Tax=Balneatrix alpica TaxID=75684 RepID=UPI002738EABD|nr:urea transporter [Balneatrix alpica]
MLLLSLRFISYHLPLASLAGIAQIIFLSSPWAGLLCLLALSWLTPLYALGLSLGVISASLSAAALGAPATVWRQGVYGFNGALVGLVLQLYFGWSPLLPWVQILAAALVTFIQLGLNAYRPLPIFTSPFILLTWLVLLLPLGLPEAAPLPAAASWLAGILLGISQVFFVASPLMALLLLGLLGWQHWRLPLYALLASCLGAGIATLLEVNPAQISQGLAGYNPVLAALAVQSLGPGWTILAIVLAALGSAWGLQQSWPMLTAPFVISSWLVLLSYHGWRYWQQGRS